MTRRYRSDEDIARTHREMDEWIAAEQRHLEGKCDPEWCEMCDQERIAAESDAVYDRVRDDRLIPPESWAEMRQQRADRAAEDAELEEER